MRRLHSPLPVRLLTPIFRSPFCFSVKLIRGSNDLGIHRSTPPLQSNSSGSQFSLQVTRMSAGSASHLSEVSVLQAAKGAPNNSPTEPYNPASYQQSMPSQFGSAFVPQHSQAALQPIGDTDRTRQILEVLSLSLPPLVETLELLRFALCSCILVVFLHLFHASLRIAVASGIWNAGDVCSKSICLCNNFFESSLERLLLVERDARREEQVSSACCYIINVASLSKRCSQTGESWSARLLPPKRRLQNSRASALPQVAS